MSSSEKPSSTRKRASSTGRASELKNEAGASGVKTRYQSRQASKPRPSHKIKTKSVVRSVQLTYSMSEQSSGHSSLHSSVEAIISRVAKICDGQTSTTSSSPSLVSSGESRGQSPRDSRRQSSADSQGQPYEEPRQPSHDMRRRSSRPHGITEEPLPAPTAPSSTVPRRSSRLRARSSSSVSDTRTSSASGSSYFQQEHFARVNRTRKDFNVDGLEYSERLNPGALRPTSQAVHSSSNPQYRAARVGDMGKFLISITKNDSPLGIDVGMNANNKPCITDIKSYGAAYGTEGLHVGQEILEINGTGVNQLGTIMRTRTFLQNQYDYRRNPKLILTIVGADKRCG